ncbi:MAG TPA: alpha-L-rhamnosidase C-terminal domain-containing protein [Phycisphaerae bacterium]|nr:alpha-L-rhamnosidase C-terminal domain-containing protein [Phycisphaerae bacterium]
MQPETGIQDSLKDEPPLPRRIWWPWDQPAERVSFERTFSIDHPAAATLFVAASGAYTAWLDGHVLPVPPSHAPSWRIIHRLPVALEPGNHCLSIEARPGGHGQPFLLAWLDWPEQMPGTAAAESDVALAPRSDNHVARIGTDANWMMMANPPEGWQLRAPAPSTEAANPGRMVPAWAFDGVWAEPWGMPCNVPDDFCRLSHGWQVTVRQGLSCVVQVHEGLTAAGAGCQVFSDGRLSLRPPLPFPPSPPLIGDVRKQDLAYRSREAHSHIVNHWLELFENRAPHAVLDAGAETFGRLRVRLRSGGPAIIAVTTGESIPEVHRHLGRVSDVFELRDGQSFATGPTGFRYVKVMALSAGSGDPPPAGAPVLLEPIEVQHIRYPVESAGSFASSDSQLNDIWQLSARTVLLCMQNEIWDGIKRDQLPWMGDLYTEALAAYHAFGDTRLARWSLGVLGELGPVPDRPLTHQRYPGLQSMWKRPGCDINGIPSYTLWWVIGLADYVQYSGDHTLVQDLNNELKAVLDHVSEWVDEDGWWRHRAGWDYVDWAPLTTIDRHLFCHLLATQVMGVGAGLLDSAGQDGQRYRQLQARMADTARRQIWRGGEGDLGRSHHVPAMLVRSGVLTPEEAAGVFRRYLAPDPPYRMTYWHRYADLSAAAIVGEIDWGLDYIRRHWGQALQLGATALWEASEPSWIGEDPHGVSMVAGEYARYGGYETSLCHGWSAGPAVWLDRAVLGICPAAPGFAAIEFSPALGSLTWAEGTVPSPRGVIRVQLQRERGNLPHAELEMPAGVSLQVPQRVRSSWAIHSKQADR